ncbi:MAG: alpha/beta hydrolase family protein [Thermoplasmata archaeon]
MKAPTIEDLLSIKNIDQISISASAKFVAAVVSDNFREYKKKCEKTYLVIYDSSLNELEKIGGYGIHSLSFSKEDLLLYVHEDLLNIYNASTKNNISIKFNGEIKDAKWYNNNILFTGHEKIDEKEDDPYFYEESDQYDDLYLLDFKEGTKKITKNRQIWEFDTDGKNIVVVCSDASHESSWYRSRLYTVDLSGNMKMVYDPGTRQVGKIRIYGNNIAFIESLMSDRGVVSGDVMLIDNGKVKNLTENEVASYSHIEFDIHSKSIELILLKNEKTKFTILKYYKKEKIWEGTGIVYPAYSPSFSYSKNRIVFSYSDPGNPLEILLLNKNVKKSEINARLKDIEQYPSKLVEWKSSDGKKIYGLLRVKNHDAPLIVYIHGGPTSFSYSSFLDRASIFLGYGFSVFLPNYRGSVGMGRNYAESNRGDLGGMDFEDIVQGIEYLRKTKEIHTDRIYITGGSYGGYMSALAIMKSDIFKASVSLFGISDWISFHGTSNGYDWDRIHFDTDPYKFDKYDKYSPIRIKHDIKTPILLMHGLNDPIVPIGQYYEFYRFVKEMGKEVHLLVFPREGHGFNEKEHKKRQYNETIKFFNDHR